MIPVDGVRLLIQIHAAELPGSNHVQWILDAPDLEVVGDPEWFNAGEGVGVGSGGDNRNWDNSYLKEWLIDAELAEGRHN